MWSGRRSGVHGAIRKARQHPSSGSVEAIAAIDISVLSTSSLLSFLTMSLSASRMLLRTPQVARLSVRHASTTSQAANAASQGASQASQGLSKATSSANSGLSKAAGAAGNALNSIGGRTGKLISFVQCT